MLTKMRISHIPRPSLFRRSHCDAEKATLRLAQIRDRRLYRDRMSNSVSFVSASSHLRFISVLERRRDGRPARVGRERRRTWPEVKALFRTSFKGASPAGVGTH